MNRAILVDGAEAACIVRNAARCVERTIKRIKYDHEFTWRVVPARRPGAASVVQYWATRRLQQSHRSRIGDETRCVRERVRVAARKAVPRLGNDAHGHQRFPALVADGDHLVRLHAGALELDLLYR